jgi:hypothetical protein
MGDRGHSEAAATVGIAVSHDNCPRLVRSAYIRSLLALDKSVDHEQVGIANQAKQRIRAVIPEGAGEGCVKSHRISRLLLRDADLV